MKRYLQFWLVNLSVSLILIAGMALTWISKGIGLFLLALSLGLGGYWLFCLWKWEVAFETLHQPLLTSSEYFLEKGQEDLKSLAQYVSGLKTKVSQQDQQYKDLAETMEVLLSHLTMGTFLVSAQGQMLLSSRSLPHYFPDVDGDISSLDDLKRMDIRNLVHQAFDQKTRLKQEVSGFHEGDLILEVTAVPVFSPTQSVEAVLVLLYDLTTIRTYEKLNLAFVSNASHELRTPVTSIKGFAETIKGMSAEEEALKDDFLDIIYKESLRLEHIVEHLLTLSKAQQMPIQWTTLSLAEFVQDLTQSLQPQLKKKDLQLKVQVPDDVTLVSDSQLLSQILLNLLSNAIRYTEQGGKIEVKTQKVNEGIKISVSDTGIGISQLEQDRIFERFYRVNKGRSRQTGGTGLGLAIVKELSQLLGGQVTVTTNGRKALALAETEPFDFILLDIMLPQLDGMEVCKRLRAKGVKTPIMMVSAKSDEFDKVLALELGADDYLTKPFSPRELLARVKAVLRRTKGEQEGDDSDNIADDSWLFGTLKVYPERHEVYKANKLLSLTPKEFELLLYLMKHPNMTLTRERLLERIWGYDFGQETRLVDVHIGKLREKIEDNPKAPQFIRTIRGYGYKFKEL
ncbi:histidine kinase PnpS [Streptococcus pneumoniae]|nr:histidine kinase PnpS [Streptococcus pneumoniae]